MSPPARVLVLGEHFAHALLPEQGVRSRDAAHAVDDKESVREGERRRYEEGQRTREWDEGWLPRLELVAREGGQSREARRRRLRANRLVEAYNDAAMSIGQWSGARLDGTRRWIPVSRVPEARARAVEHLLRQLRRADRLNLLPGQRPPEEREWGVNAGGYAPCERLYPRVTCSDLGRVALPSRAATVPIEDLTPVEAAWAIPEQRTGPPVLGIEVAAYEELVRRSIAARYMVLRETSAVGPVNGIFFREKADGRLRLIVDARPANACVSEPDNPKLPIPGDLAEVEWNPHEQCHVGKSDLSDYYHHLALPAALVRWFALPAVRSSAVGANGPPRLLHPCVTAIPMGWSHSVTLAQRAHVAVLRRDRVLGGLLAAGSSGRWDSRTEEWGRVIILVYIDDLVILGSRARSVNLLLDRALAAYRAVGLQVKPAKVVRPPSPAVTVLGFQLTEDALLAPSPEKLQRLVERTVAVVRARVVSVRTLQQVLGGWVWFLTLRRPLLSILERCYAEIEQAQQSGLYLSRLARKELCDLLSVAPLLQADLGQTQAHYILATDASNSGGGMVYGLNPGLPGEPTRFGPGNREWTSAVVREAEWVVAHAYRFHMVRPIAELEAFALCHGVLWWCRTSAPDRRLSVLVDSQAVGGAVAKGRSSSPLNWACRRLAALSLCHGVTLRVRWVPSEANPADEPSRRYHNHGRCRGDLPNAGRDAAGT